NGTFRWARNADDLRNQIETLADELSKQYVLSFDYDESIQNKTFQLICGDLTSPFVKLGIVNDRPSHWWIWLLVGAGLLGIIGVVLVAWSRRNVEYHNFNAPKQAQPEEQQVQAQAQQPQVQQQGPRGVGRGTVTVLSGALQGTRVGIAIGAA